VQSFWEQNIAVLKKKDLTLYENILNYHQKKVADIIPTKSVPTFGMIYNTLPILKNKNNLHDTICIFIGMCLGYNQLIVFKERKDIFRFVILEPSLDLFCMALQYVDLRQLLQSDKVYILAGNINWDNFNTAINQKNIETDFLFSDFVPLFDWNPEIYNNTRHKARAYATRAISGPAVLKNFGEQLFKNRVSNLTLFNEMRPVEVLASKFKNKPAILVSAGPSLDDSMEELKKAVGKCALIAVDSAVLPLLRNGITPDIVTTLDYRDYNSEKLSPDLIQPANLQPAKFSLITGVLSSTLTSKRLSLKNIFFTFQDNDTQGWILDALKIKYQMSPVTSVALFSLWVAQIIKADPIIMVGYDFALTSTEKDHVKNAVFSHNVNLKWNCLKVPSINGGSVNTTDLWFESKQNFEQLLKNHSRKYINSTKAGVHIQGTTVCDLTSVIRQYMNNEVKSSDIINTAFQSNLQLDITVFTETANRQIDKAKKLLQLTDKILTQNQIIELFLKNKTNLKSIHHFSELPQKIQECWKTIENLYTDLSTFDAINEIIDKKIGEANRIQELEIANHYIDKFDKDCRILKIRMQGFQYGLEIFIKYVNKLILHLKNEKKFLTKIKNNKYNEGTLLELCDLYIDSMDIIKARKIITKCMTEYPNSGQAIFRMGIIWAHLLNFDKAFQFWETAQTKSPDIKNSILKKRKELAEYWIERGKKDHLALEKYLMRALQLYNDQKFCIQQKEFGWAKSATIINQHINNNNLEQAETFLLLWQPIRKNTPVWYYYMAKVLSEKNKKNDALSFIEKALTKAPNNPTWLALSARLLLETDKFEQGIACLEKAVQLDSSQAVLWEELGDTLFELKDYSSATISYKKCYIALPNKTDVLKKIEDCDFYLKAHQTQ